MNDKIKINLQIADSNYPLTINREEEQMVREAAKQVNVRLNKYREVYKNSGTRKNYCHGSLSVLVRETAIDAT